MVLEALHHVFHFAFDDLDVSLAAHDERADDLEL